MATIYVDNKPYRVGEGQNLLGACLSLGFDLPYFCWHPAMHSVGACRQCAVKMFKDEKDTRGRIVMACMTPALDGTRISIDDPEARKFRASVIEWLMLNHPHDCPVCDEGGECHLQDMTVMTGHVYRKTRFRKRTHRNQDLGPFINHEMNRCIQCYRCVRFYNDYAGGRDFGVFAAHDNVYFGRHEDGILENEFSGNLIEVCPTGVFTDKTLKRHYTRKWDLQTAPSVCVHCGLGCNILPGERYGSLRRIRNRFNRAVNGYFLCDRGRFGYEFANSGNRVKRCLRKVTPDAETTLLSESGVTNYLTSTLYFGAKVIGIGSPRASLEANFALRTLVGEKNFSHGMSEKESGLIAAIRDILRKGPAPSASLDDVRAADAILILGEDITNTAPMLALNVKQSVKNKPMEILAKFQIPRWNDAAVRAAIQNERGPLFVSSVSGTHLDSIATHVFRGTPDGIALLGFSVASKLAADSPEVRGLSEGTDSLAAGIAQALREARRPLVISGTGCGTESVIRAAANVAWALRENGIAADICYAVPECNSLGVGMMGGRSLEDALNAVLLGEADTVVILENDLYRRADASLLEIFFGSSKNVIVLDHLMNRTSLKADLLLPAAVFAETGGTYVNHEGRAQRFFSVFVPDGEIRGSREWIAEMMSAAARPDAGLFSSADKTRQALAKSCPEFSSILETAPAADFRLAGQRVPRQPHRYSGRTAMNADIDIHEPKAPEDADAPLSFSMEGYPGEPPSSLITHFWAPGWNSVQSVNKFQDEVNGHLHGGDPGKRLIEPPEEGRVSYFEELPSPFERREGEWLMLPAFHIFGSEELSVHSPAVRELAPRPYIGLNPADMKDIGVAEGEDVVVGVGGITFKTRAKGVASICRGAAVLPQGVPPMEWISLPAWGRIGKEGSG